MDEPCSALDPISTLAIEDLIDELKDEYTIVIVTHNMQQAARVSDQTGVLQPRRHRQARPADRDRRRRRTIFSNPDREGHRGLHLRPLRISPLGKHDGGASVRAGGTAVGVKRSLGGGIVHAGASAFGRSPGDLHAGASALVDHRGVRTGRSLYRLRAPDPWQAAGCRRAARLRSGS